MNKFQSARKQSFLEGLARASLDAPTDDLTVRCKFNFSYFDEQPAGQSFSDWDHPALVALLGKLKEYCKRPLEHWENERIGKSGTVLAFYNEFPRKSNFTNPRHVPHQARWGRFRLRHSVRLVGFTIPSNYHGKPHPETGQKFDKNVFYVVFLDAEHKFWTSEAK